MDSLKIFIKKFLHKNSKKLYLCAFHVDENEFLYNVLELCKTILEFGFYKTVEEINDLLQNLLPLLNGSNDVSNREEKEKLKEKLDRKDKLFKFSTI